MVFENSQIKVVIKMPSFKTFENVNGYVGLFLKHFLGRTDRSPATDPVRCLSHQFSWLC